MGLRRTWVVWMASLAFCAVSSADIVWPGQYVLNFSLVGGGTYTARVDILALRGCEPPPPMSPLIHTAVLLQSGVLQERHAKPKVEILLGDVFYHFELQGESDSGGIRVVGDAHRNSASGPTLGQSSGFFAKDQQRPPLVDYRVRPMNITFGANDGHGGQPARTVPGLLLYGRSGAEFGCYEDGSTVEFAVPGIPTRLDYIASWPAHPIPGSFRTYEAVAFSQQPNGPDTGCLSVDFKAQYMERLNSESPLRPVRFSGRLRETCTIPR